MPLYILEELHGNERDAGLAMTYFQLGTVLCRPFAGKIIDSLNKHRLLVAGSCAFLLIMTENPKEKHRTPMSEWWPWLISGMSSSTTT